jgi:hypothetical protein
MISPGRGLREPRLVVWGDELLLYGHEVWSSGEQMRVASGLSSTRDGDRWSPWEELEDGWIYWSVVVREGRGYCLCSQPGAGRVILKVSEDGRSWGEAAEVARRHGAEWPNEATLTFKEDGTAYALVRCDAGPGHPLLCQANPPYDEWHHAELDMRLQAPLIWLAEEEIWIAGRWYQPSDAANISVFRVDGVRAVPQLVLPSGGDVSHPGIAQKQGTDNIFIFSYGSGHEGLGRAGGHDSSAIYVAELEMP